VSSLLRFDGVACIRGGRLLFEGVDLSLGCGDALHLVGPNGSGKSSLIRLAAGLLKPAAGTVERGGRVALADEHLALDRELVLEAALSFWAGPREHLLGALAAFDLARLVRVPVRLLSTGQARRARLARVVASAAPLWLLDEPLNGLDSEGAARLADAIAAHRTAGGAVLAASHQPLGDGWSRLELGR